MSILSKRIFLLILSSMGICFLSNSNAFALAALACNPYRIDFGVQKIDAPAVERTILCQSIHPNPIKIVKVSLKGNSSQFDLKKTLSVQEGIFRNGETFELVIGFVPTEQPIGQRSAFVDSLQISVFDVTANKTLEPSNTIDRPITLRGAGTPLDYTLDQSQLFFEKPSSPPNVPIPVKGSLILTYIGTKKGYFKAGGHNLIPLPVGGTDKDSFKRLLSESFSMEPGESLEIPFEFQAKDDKPSYEAQANISVGPYDLPDTIQIPLVASALNPGADPPESLYFNYRSGGFFKTAGTCSMTPLGMENLNYGSLPFLGIAVMIYGMLALLLYRRSCGAALQK